MEPGEYLTNVLTSNNFASITYEYFEPQILSSPFIRKQLQRLESGWRQEGRLVHCDPFRDGIWIFQNTSNTSTDSPIKETSFWSLADAHNIVLQPKDRGAYEPASLARSKQLIVNSANTPSNSSSPSSSLESTIRNAQNQNVRSFQNNATSTIAQELPTPSPGIRSGTGSDAPISPKDIHEYFISSVLSSIVYFLCRNHGFIPLNSRTLIFAPQKSNSPFTRIRKCNSILNGIELTTLDISMTSLGTLVIKGHSDMAPGLQNLVNSSSSVSSLDRLAPGASLWLAPGGNAAKFYSSLDDMQLPGGLSISQIQANTSDQRPNGYSTLTIKSWQSKCLDWLSTKGLDSTALERGGWIFVQVLSGHSPYFNQEFQGIPILEEFTIVPWPVLLCFQAPSAAIRDVQSESLLGGRDPLSFAQDWFIDKDERGTVISKRQRDRQAAEVLSKEQADVEARALQSVTYSPAALRRGSNAGAMYPTPPDAPHHLIGATPSFDGTASTPGNPSQFGALEPGTVHLTNTSMADADADLWGSSGKKEQANSGVNFNDNDNDNLFGDMGGDMFVTDVTDADFSFFDEPDAVQLDHKGGSPTASVLATLKDTGNVVETTSSNDMTMIDSGTLHEDVPIQNPDQATDLHIKPLGLPVTNDHESATNLIKRNLDSKPSTPNHPQPPVDLPFNKETVFKRLLQDPARIVSRKQHRRASLFNRIDFEQSIVSVNEKYGARGQFTFSTQRQQLQRTTSSKLPGLPRTEYLINRRRTQDDGLNFGSLARLLRDKDSVAQTASNEPMDYLMDSDYGSQVSEQDDTSHATNELSLTPRLGVKRKWENDGGDEIASTFDALAMDFENPVSTPHSISGAQIPLLEADPADWSLITYFTSPDPEVQSNALSDLERIATAQILADQAVSGTLQLPGAAIYDPLMESNKIFSTKSLMHNLAKAARYCLKDIQTCNMRSFLDIQGIPVLNQALRLPPRPNPSTRAANGVEGARTNNPFPIPPPQLDVRRAESKLSILPAAVSFWENLGLSPSQGPKDINAVCIYPKFEGMAENANIFLDQMRSVYESSRFGTHDRLESKDLVNSLLPYAVDLQQRNKIHHLTALKETTARLSRIISSSQAEEKNFLVYFIYPVDSGALLVHICSAFQHLFNLHRKALSEKRINVANELVLQLIPLDFIASPTSLAVPLPVEYFRLAMEVYDRCIDFSSSPSAPAIMLEQPLPKSIDFKLNATPSASLLQENTCLHVAYAQSIDDRWITAVWTDNRGTQQMTASYCLGRKSEPISMPFSDVANEIWETTLDFISSKKIHWRIMIARIGVMDPSEIDFWASLASTESDAQLSLTLITVQTDPSLRLLPASITLSPNGNAQQSVGTPVSTPQALQTSIVSPENVATPARDNASAATPVEAPSEPDSDARLVDYTDQSWGVILSHRLNNSNSLMELNPALISGYLIKRGGTNVDDPPIVMEVNIIYTEVVGNPRTFHEGLLRELLGYYRGLGTLARVRGIVDATRDLRPWHIAAAEKAVKALYMLM